MALHRSQATVCRILGGGLMAMAISTPLTLSLAQPAQAGFIDTVRSILSGNTGDQATGRSRGGATRDGACAADPGGETNIPEMVALVPTTAQSTTEDSPTIFLYVPFDQDEPNLVLEFELVNRGDFAEESLVTELPLPAQAGLVAFQFPSTEPLDVDTTYEWAFRLICQVEQPTADSAPSTTAIPASDSGDDPLDIGDISITDIAGDSAASDTVIATVRQEMFGDIQRVETPDSLETALASSLPSDRYQAYLDHDIWFEMVATLAEAPASEEWVAFLDAFVEQLELDVDLAAQPITFLP